MNTRNNIKISFGEPTYMIFGDRTKCYMKFDVKLPPVLEKIAEVLVDKHYIPAMPKSCRGYATVHPKDDYEESTGLKVSMAKAEVDAYTKVENWLIDISNILVDKAHSLIDDFVIKGEKVIKHDNEFLKKF